MRIQKIDMAVQQLEDALQGYFAGRYFSAIVLASAAEQLFAGYLRRVDLRPAFDADKSAIAKIAGVFDEAKGSRAIGDQLNRVPNLSKHAGPKDLEQHFDPQGEASLVLERALQNFEALSSMDLPVLPLAQKFAQELCASIRLE